MPHHSKPVRKSRRHVSRRARRRSRSRGNHRSPKYRSARSTEISVEKEKEIEGLKETEMNTPSEWIKVRIEEIKEQVAEKDKKIERLKEIELKTISDWGKIPIIEQQTELTKEIVALNTKLRNLYTLAANHAEHGRNAAEQAAQWAADKELILKMHRVGLEPTTPGS